MCQTCVEFNPFQPDFLHPEPLYADAPASTETEVRLGPGQSLNGHLSPGDEDWIRLEVSRGTTYVLSTGDGTGDAVKDTLLVLYDRHGTEIALNDDDGPGFHAEITFEATNQVYYAAVSTYQGHFGFPTTDEGTYSLWLGQEGRPGGGSSEGPPGSGLPVFSNDQIAHQLAQEYWQDSGRQARGFDVDLGAKRPDPIFVDVSGLGAEGRWFAEHALAAWSDISGLTFSNKPPPSGTPVGIRFDDEMSGAYASTTIYPSGKTANVFVNISKGWISGDQYSYNSYGLQTYMHEIGHALGLGHAGAYNTGDGLSINYANHAEFANDSWQATVMSYFSQDENLTVDGSHAYLLTPTAADILAVQTLYGASGTLRGGNTVYGEGSTAGDHFDNLAKLWGTMAFTLVDDGGIDRLNVTDTEASQRIDLRPESLSDLNGYVGTMGIARGTWIEHLSSGDGDDWITGNRTNNRLEAGAGDDRVRGISGRDTLLGGAGDDTLLGEGGRDRLVGGAGKDRLNGGNGQDKLAGGNGADRLHGEGGRDFLTGGQGRDLFVFAPRAGFDRIVDFADGLDRIDLRDFDLTLDDVQDALSQRGRYTVLDLDSTRVEIKDTDIADFGARDFLL